MKEHKGKYKLVEERTSKNTGKPYWIIQVGEEDKPENKFCVIDPGLMTDLTDGCMVRIEVGDTGNAVSKLEKLDGQVTMEDVVDEEPKKKEVKEPIVIKEGENYFAKLLTVKADAEKKGNLSYISWANAWSELKKVFPTATYKVYENKDDMPYFVDDTGGFVKVGVTVNEVEHISYLPIMNYQNKALKKAEMNTFDINKAIQRALVKAIAYHGLGLYIYKGEDLPEG